jgi:hypothetical protein
MIDVPVPGLSSSPGAGPSRGERILGALAAVLRVIDVHEVENAAVQRSLVDLAALLVEEIHPQLGLVVHLDGERFWVDGFPVTLAYPQRVSLLRDFDWMERLGVDEVRVEPGLDAQELTHAFGAIRESIHDGVLAGSLTDPRLQGITLARRATDAVDWAPGRREQDDPCRLALLRGLERLAVWAEGAALRASAGWPPEVVPARILLRFVDAVREDEGYALAVALRADPSASLGRHLARSALLTVVRGVGLGLSSRRIHAAALGGLTGVLGLGVLGERWWQEGPATTGRVLLARAPRVPLQDSVGTDRAVRLRALASLLGTDDWTPGVPMALEDLLFAASAWLDRARQGLHGELPRCTPTQARAALGNWLRSRPGCPVGFPHAVEALLGAVPPGSIVRTADGPGFLRGEREVVQVDDAGRVRVVRVDAAAAACSEPEEIPVALLGVAGQVVVP